MNKIYAIVFALFFTISGSAQEELAMPAIPAIRALHHDDIIRSLKTIAQLKSKTDSIFPVTGNEALNEAIDKAVKTGVHNMRAGIELNTTLDDNARFKWLRGINEMLTGFISAYRSRSISAVQLPGLIKAYSDAMQAELTGNSIFPIVEDQEPEVGKILIDNYALRDNIGLPAARDILVLKACQRNPEKALAILNKYPESVYADSLIILAAFHYQEELYTYASASNALGRRIQAIDQPLVKTIAGLARTNAGRMYFPFLDNIYRGKVTIDSLAPLILQDSSYKYYKLLVKTRIEYVERMQRGDTPMAMQVLTNKIRSKAVELFINDINGLHDERDENIRFRKLDPLTPEELYYMAVLGEEEIYTSSFVRGVYPRIFQRMRNPRSDSLLMLVHDDYYKKFIKMCASYNTLDNFLSRMDNTTAQKLMRSFVNGLDNTKTLEEAVDVADSYASIYNDQIKDLIMEQVQQKLRESRRQQNKRGEFIYNLLNIIFLSMDSTNHINVSARLGIDPVYTMPNRLLRDTSGRIIIQQFSYGDKESAAYFSAFVNRFSNANWKIKKTPDWIEISSAKGEPVTIYANLPLDEKKDFDIKAQDSLISYLDQQNLSPAIVIHRGHSYYLRETISRLSPDAKVVLVGSCGGYQKLYDILNICPAAHIISSKQVAAGVINQSLIDAITETLRQGKDLDWSGIWKTAALKVGAGYKDKFEDYIPPDKNLGAIFIMAYNKVWEN